MKFKILTIALLTAFISLSAHAVGEQFGAPGGSLTIWSVDPGDIQGGYRGFTQWGLADLQAITSDNVDFILKPNTNGYVEQLVYDSVTNPDFFVDVAASDWRNNSGAGPDGGLWLETSASFATQPIPEDADTATLSFDVTTYDLDPRYTAGAFIAVRATSGEWVTQIVATNIITTTGPVTVTLPGLSTYGGETPQYQLSAGFTMGGINANPATDWGEVALTITDLSFTSLDNAPPLPNPMQFSTVPYPVSDSAISMTASNAVDDYNDVEFLFTNTVNNTSSEWQSDPTWVDSGPSTPAVTNIVTVFTDPDYLDIGGSWDAFVQGTGTVSPLLFVTSTVPTVATVSPTSAVEWNFYEEFNDLDGSYTFTIDADNITLPAGNARAFVKEFDGGMGWIGFAGDEPLVNGATASITFNAVAGNIYQVGTISTSAGSYDVSNPDMGLTEEIIPGTDLGLDALTEYTYQVKARDTSLNANETLWSTAASATTFDDDFDAPTPATMTIASSDASSVSIQLTADPASDPSGVEYYFTCTAGPGNDSGWQSSTVYFDTDLVPGTNYSYTVIARDLSAAKNSNTVSAAENIMTLATPAAISFANTLTGYTGDTDIPASVLAVEKDGLTTGSINELATIDFDVFGATFGDGVVPGYPARNLLKTLASTYADVSFEAYVTFILSTEPDLSAYIGLGQGIQTGTANANWGVPELALEGVSGVFAEFKDSTAGGIKDSRILKIYSGLEQGNTTSSVVANDQTIRARLIYDAVANTVSVDAQTGYTGGTYTPNLDLGTMSTIETNSAVDSVFLGAPARVYVGGGEGTIVKDFQVTVTDLPLTMIDLAIAEVPAGVEISWDGAAGQSYIVEYTVGLGSPTSWLPDLTVGNPIVDLGGAMSVTSTVPVDVAFYRFILDE